MQHSQDATIPIPTPTTPTSCCWPPGPELPGLPYPPPEGAIDPADIRELPLVIQDRVFQDDSRLWYPAAHTPASLAYPEGTQPPLWIPKVLFANDGSNPTMMTVNGRTWPKKVWGWGWEGGTRRAGGMAQHSTARRVCAEDVCVLRQCVSLTLHHACCRWLWRADPGPRHVPPAAVERLQLTCAAAQVWQVRTHRRPAVPA